MTDVDHTAGSRFGTALGLWLNEPVSARHFRDARQAGFACVEVAAYYRDHMRGTRAEIDAIKAAAHQNGISIESVHLGFDALAGDQQDRMDAFVRRDLDLAAELGAGVLVVHMSIFADPDRMIVENGKCHPGLTVDRDLDAWPPMMDKIRRKLAEYVRWAETLGVALALETDCRNSHRLVEFAEPFPPESCGICFDTGHAEMDLGAVRLAELLGPRTITTHLHDNDGQSDQHLPPFHGSIDWAGFVAALRRAGYRGPMMFETLTGTLRDLEVARDKLLALWQDVRFPRDQ